MNLKQLKNKAFKNPEVKEEYEKLSYEFELTNQLLKMRKASGLTQEQIAKKMGTTRSNICRLEKLGTHPRVDTVEKYAKACGYQMHFNFKPVEA
ncbi:MAG: XRE family transcriptional regulator [Gammaproteobacteria bacterium]|nr:MAG: XRE family transcriptional regulator [Gammaproteobacteria bacterium]UTW43622.1 helix-turn-helix transcriptional regulator [bacterium SCSIO 12844]